MRGRFGASYQLDLRSARRPAFALLVGGLCLGTIGSGLGLPCPSLVIVGIPCPACGLTTAVRNVMSGNEWAGIRAAPIVVVIVAVALYALIARRLTMAIPYVVIALIVGAEWIYELFRFSIL